MDNYRYLGIVFISFSIPFSLYSYFILLNVPFSAFGLSTLILGLTLMQVPSSPVPARQIAAMIEASLVNIESLLEEYDALGKAVYIPFNDRVNAFIPLSGENTLIEIDVSEIHIRVLTRIGETDGLLVFPPGSELVRLALLPEDTGLEDALNTVLVDNSELVESIKAVRNRDEIIVELHKPKQNIDFDRVNKSLGSLGVSIAGSVISQVTKMPVALENEVKEARKTTGFYKVMENPRELAERMSD